MLYLRKPLTLLLALLTTLLGWRSVVDMSSWDAQAVYRYGRGILRPASEGILLSNEPKPSLRDNLRKDLRYITALPHDGWNNQIMQMFNLIHLALKLRQSESSSSELIPILPPFVPTYHLKSGFVPTLPFSEVFDIDRLSAAVDLPLVEFKQLKSVEPCCGETEHARPSDQWRTLEQKPNVRDSLSCWGSLQTQFKRPNLDPNPLEKIYELDIDYTPLPSTLLSPRRYDSWAPHAMVHHLFSSFFTPFAHNRLRDFYLEPPYAQARDVVASMGDVKFEDVMGDEKSGWRKPELEKEGDILCFQSLFYYSDFEEPEEWFRSDDETAAWRMVGQHVHWSPHVLGIAADTVRRIVAGGEAEQAKGRDRWGKRDAGMPKFIGMHIRRTDFMPACGRPDCLSVADYAAQLDVVVRKLKEAGVDETLPVVVGTDETDAEYLAEIRARGWHLIDHIALDTVALHGEWYPTILDACIFSMSTGLVGTKRSTMTLLAQRRAQTWNPLFVTSSVDL